MLNIKKLGLYFVILLFLFLVSDRIEKNLLNPQETLLSQMLSEKRKLTGKIQRDNKNLQERENTKQEIITYLETEGIKSGKGNPLWERHPQYKVFNWGLSQPYNTKNILETKGFGIRSTKASGYWGDSSPTGEMFKTRFYEKSNKDNFFKAESNRNEGFRFDFILLKIFEVTP